MLNVLYRRAKITQSLEKREYIQFICTMVRVGIWWPVEQNAQLMGKALSRRTKIHILMTKGTINAKVSIHKGKKYAVFQQ